MSQHKDHRAEVMTLPAFDSQDDSVLEAINSMSSENEESVTFDYLQECVNSLESKDSGINLSPVSSGVSNSSLHLDNLKEEYKSTDDHDLSNLDMSFIKMESIFFKSEVDLEPRGTVERMDESHSSESMNIFETTCSQFGNSTDSIENVDYNGIDSDALGGTFDNIENVHESRSQNDDSNRSDNADERFEGDAQSSRSEYFTDEYGKISTAKSSPLGNADLDAGVESKDNILHHEYSLEKQAKTCTQCPMTFRYKKHLDRHLEGHEKNNCPQCSAKFARRKHLDVHLFRSHGERTTKYPHTCDICARSFLKQILLVRHRTKHHYVNGAACPKCGDVLTTDAEVKEHVERHDGKMQLKSETQCSRTFDAQQICQSNPQNHQDYKCSVCNATFATEKGKEEHFKVAHSVKSAGSASTANGSYFCADCRQGFVKKHSYCRHLATAAHLGRVNEQVPLSEIHGCPICSKQLTSRQARDQHIRRVHKDEKRFACDTHGCAFQSANKRDLDRHKQLHVEERNVVCEHCGKAFTSVGILKDHVLYVHNKERQFVCEECGKAFKRNSLLNRHKLSHQQIRPFPCKHCNAAFKRSHHLTRHMETCHRITLEKKKKVVKLMKTEDGQLVPVPEKPKKPKAKKATAKKESHPVGDQNSVDVMCKTLVNGMDASPTDISTELQQVENLLPSADAIPENSDIPMELSNLLSVGDPMPQVLSLVDVHSGQVVTVEVASPDTLPLNDLVDQFEANCGEMLDLSSYQDLGFQTGILNSDQNYYDHTAYTELPLESVEESPLLMDPNNGKMDSLPTIENYLTQPFSPFLNL